MDVTKCNNINIIAGIVLYNPNIERLRENIEAIKQQVDKIVFVDNGSKNKDYNQLLNPQYKYVLINNQHNKGIACALNQIMNYAEKHGYTQVLTLDQDSVCTPNMVTTLIQYSNNNVGIVCPITEDRNFKEDFSYLNGKGVIEIDWCITSGSLTNVRAWKKAGGFDERLFIDWVDWDFCIALKHKGFKILRTENAKLIHELGNGTFWAQLFGKWRMILNRPAKRYYYVYRNRIYLARKWPEISMKEQLCELWWQTMTCMKYEQHRMSNLWAFIQGIIMGLTMQINRNH